MDSGERGVRRVGEEVERKGCCVGNGVCAYEVYVGVPLQLAGEDKALRMVDFM